jgi:uncharacterized protein YciW
MSEEGAADLMDRIAGLAPGSPVAALRRERCDVVRYTEGAYAALFAPKETGGVSRAERLAIALRIAQLNEDRALEEHYRDALAALGGEVKEDARWAAILRHVDRVTRAPGTATKAHLGEFAAVGVGTREIVTISQLIAFVNYQVRVLAGLRLLGGAR